MLHVEGTLGLQVGYTIRIHCHRSWVISFMAATLEGKSVIHPVHGSCEHRQASIAHGKTFCLSTTRYSPRLCSFVLACRTNE